MTDYSLGEKMFIKAAIKSALAETNIERQRLWRSGNMESLMLLDDKLVVYESAWEKLKRELGL